MGIIKVLPYKTGQDLEVDEDKSPESEEIDWKRIFPFTKVLVRNKGGQWTPQYFLYQSRIKLEEGKYVTTNLSEFIYHSPQIEDKQISQWDEIMLYDKENIQEDWYLD